MTPFSGVRVAGQRLRRVLGLDLEEDDLRVPPVGFLDGFVANAADHLLDRLYADGVRHDSCPAVRVVEDVPGVVAFG